MATRPRTKRVDTGAMLADLIARLETKTGYKLDAAKAIPDDQTFTQWCEQLGDDGLKVDGHAFTLKNRPAMAWLYDQIPSTMAQAFRRTLVLMKCTQVGFTVMEMLATIYLGMKFQPCTVGMFLPDISLAEGKSTERFMPIVRTVPAAYKLMTQDAADGSGRKQGEGNVRRRRIGEALFLFAWTSGKASTESFPMDFLTFDEVQEMSLAQMEKTRERLSASDYRYNLMGSTANWPDSDIHHWYKLGTQHRFHTECPTCHARKPLDEYFPACIKWDPDLPDPVTHATGSHRYVCENGHWIDDPQHGEWLPDNPEAWITSAHFPQMLSPTISPGEIWDKFITSTDKKNFYNRVLGKPWLDPDQIPVTLEHMANCVAAGKAAGLTWKKKAKGAFMGLDQMGCFSVAVIKERMPDGRQAVIHLEEIYSDDPFARCDELMVDYGIAVCVVEINPNYSEAQRFAKRHEGRVFLCNGFGELPDDMVKWGDGPKIDTSDRRTDDEYRTRFVVKADQFKCMQASFSRFTSKVPTCLFPDPQDLAQDVIDNGHKHRAAIAPRAFDHFTKTALVVEKVKDAAGQEATTNKFRRVVRKIKIDPHFSYANQLADVAWARSHGTSSFIIPDVPSNGGHTLSPEDIGIGPLAIAVDSLRKELLTGSVCGRCSSFDESDGMCTERWFTVNATDTACSIFIAKA